MGFAGGILERERARAREREQEERLRKKKERDAENDCVPNSNPSLLVLCWLTELPSVYSDGLPAGYHVWSCDRWLHDDIITFWMTSGHSRPHLQVPSVNRYALTSSREDRQVPLGLQTRRQTPVLSTTTTKFNDFSILGLIKKNLIITPFWS